MKREDSVLLAAVADGDIAAFEELYLRYHRPLAAFLFKMTGRRGLVEELVNDVMVVVWLKASTFAGRSQVSTWIMGVAYRKALKAIRYKGDIVIESFTTDVKVIARAAAIWRKIEPRRDDISVNGLKFLKKAFGKK